MKIACIGEPMVELSLDSEGKTAQIGFSGDTLNTAVYLKRTAPGLDVSYVTRLGQDSFSNRMEDFIAGQDLDTTVITRSDDRSIGLYAIATDEAGERSFSYWRSHSAARQLFQTADGFDFGILQQFDVVYFSAITLAILPTEVRAGFLTWLAAYRADGGQVAFDSNYRPALWPDSATARADIAAAWGLTDIALPSVDDEMAAFGDVSEDAVVARLKACGVTQGALKRGPEGPFSLGAKVSATYSPAAKVVDTTAAGDSFNGGYLGALLAGQSQAEALQSGHDLARRVVGFKGGIMPRDAG